MKMEKGHAQAGIHNVELAHFILKKNEKKGG